MFAHGPFCPLVILGTYYVLYLVNLSSLVYVHAVFCSGNRRSVTCMAMKMSRCMSCYLLVINKVGYKSIHHGQTQPAN